MAITFDSIYCYRDIVWYDWVSERLLFNIKWGISPLYHSENMSRWWWSPLCTRIWTDTSLHSDTSTYCSYSSRLHVLQVSRKYQFYSLWIDSNGYWTNYLPTWGKHADLYTNNAVNMVDYMLFILTITRQAHTIKLAWFIYHVILFHRQKSMQLQGSYIVNDPVNFVIASI